ncbi:MAG: nitronate monooxygenase [Candidatus Eremiobacteraeota bacterium]|nr:nitronate monooxygenase [Candidatus Eremiobacteraeota bacterium]
MATLHTHLNDLLGIAIPIFNAPMTPQAGGALAAAVSDAGAFGMLGFDEDESAESIHAQVELLHEKPGRNFGIGLVAWVLERRPELLQLAIEAKPKLVSISFGDPQPYVDRLHAEGILVASQVQSKAWAQTAIDAGVDILIVQGTEAGGHTGAVGTLPLLQIVLEMTDKPVIAAGGIATGRGLAAVLAAGAVGGWIGTPFLLACESRTASEAQARIASSDETQTILTSVYDRIQGKAWPAEFRGRALRNPFVDKWNDNADEMMQTPDAITAFQKAKSERDFNTAHIYASQTVGLLDQVRSARDIVTSIASSAIQHIAAVNRLLQL